jgi:ribosomal protein L11 methyltransferase
VTALPNTDRPSAEGYWTLTVSLGSDAVDAVSNYLWETGAIGVVEEGDAGPVALRAFFPPGSEPADVRGRLLSYLEALVALAVPVEPSRVEVARVPEAAWADAWRAHFRPLAVGRRLLVCPPWEVPPPPADGRASPRVVVLIEPGRAFGTGGHATTRGCLELLERTLAARPAASVLDVGTGSGILGITAARLGVERVRAIDLDPDAVAAAAANAVRNGVADHFRVELGVPEGEPPAELVLANLLGAALVALAPDLGRCVTASGRLIAGGLLVQEAPAVVASFGPEGFALVEVVEHEGWATLLLVRHGRRCGDS